MRLVAFGCSNTFGKALPDVWDYEKNKEQPFNQGPSKYAWPQLLADKLNVECINNGIPGASNKEIWWNIINYNFQKNDIVFVLWSSLNRTCIIEEDDLNSIGNWEQKHKIFFTTYHNNFDQYIQFFLYCNYVHYFLQNKVKLLKHLVPVFMSRALCAPSSFFKFKDGYGKILTNDPLVNFEKTKLLYDKKAMDKIHSGLEAHNTFAEEIYNEIKNENTEKLNRKQ